MSQDTAPPVLSIRDLTVGLPAGGDRRHAIEGISLDVRPREIVCIVGESGSGKSVTAFATMGLLPKALQLSEGRILFDGKDLLKLDEAAYARLRGNRIAMIFQEPMTALNPCYTVGDQIAEVFAEHASLPRAERRVRTLALLEQVHLPEPESIYRRYPHQLSGGQRQRIAIAMALALDPVLLIADEPTTALDVTTQAQILRLIRDLKGTHAAGILFVTHDFDVVAEIADRVVVMRAGKVVEQGPAEQVLNRPISTYARELIASVPRPRPKAPSPQHRPVAMRVRGLEKTYTDARSLFAPARRTMALKPTDFDVAIGETLGIVGESGSGKSTLVRCLTRLIDPDKGEIMIAGNDLATMPRSRLRAVRKDIQIVFQDPYGSLNPRRTIGEQMIAGPLNFGTPRSEAMADARRLMRLVRLGEDSLDRYPSQFSGGQRQRICIARALMLKPKILVADEAVSALDVSVQKQVLALLADIRSQLGLTMLFITHDLRVASEICENVIVMSRGEIVERGPIDAVFADPKHPYTRQLLASMPGQGWSPPDFAAAPAPPEPDRRERTID